MKSPAKSPSIGHMSPQKKHFLYFRREYMLYLLMLPGLLYFVVFKYIPMYGVTIAFQDYNIFNPQASLWVGFKNFETLFSQPGFRQALWNNISISLLKLILGFPFPIILSLMINEIANRRFKR